MTQTIRKENPRLHRKALHYLARREHTRDQLRKKLLRHGDAGEVDVVLDRLVSDNALSESRYLESYIRTCESKLYGPRYITASLCHQGFDPNMIERTLSALHLDWLACARRFHKKKFALGAAIDEQERQRRIHAMQRRGFDEETIRAALGVRYED